MKSKPDRENSAHRLYDLRRIERIEDQLEEGPRLDHHKRDACDAAQTKAIGLLQGRFRETGELMPSAEVATEVGLAEGTLRCTPAWAKYRRARRSIQEKIWARKRKEFLELVDEEVRSSGCYPAVEPLARSLHIGPKILLEDKSVKRRYERAKRRRRPLPRGKGPSPNVDEAIECLQRQVRETGHLPSIPRVASLVDVSPGTLYGSRRFMTAYRNAGNEAEPAPKQKKQNATELKAIELLRGEVKKGKIPAKSWIARKLGIRPSNIGRRDWPAFMEEYDRLVLRRATVDGRDGQGLVDARHVEEEFGCAWSMLNHWEEYCPWLDSRKLDVFLAPPIARPGRHAAEKLKHYSRTDLETIVNRQEQAKQASESGSAYEDGLGAWIPEPETARRCEVPLVRLTSLRLHHRAKLGGVRVLRLCCGKRQYDFWHEGDIPQVKRLLAEVSAGNGDGKPPTPDEAEAGEGAEDKLTPPKPPAAETTDTPNDPGAGGGKEAGAAELNPDDPIDAQVIKVLRAAGVLTMGLRLTVPNRRNLILGDWKAPPHNKKDTALRDDLASQFPSLAIEQRDKKDGSRKAGEYARRGQRLLKKLKS
ncbi:MAG TPA: hypothetical protein VMY37_05600 [Thermoguttaceae bacterium]|nr:hypothetical protein [Thermoguttaceae bacterium]